MQLVSTNMAGNLMQVSGSINEIGLAKFVLAMDFKTGNYTVVVFRVPDDIAPRLRKYFGQTEEYWLNPEPELKF